MKKLTITEIMEHYENVRLAKSVMGIGFIVSNEKGDFLEVHDLRLGEFRFIHDNFPGPRRFFSTNIPYTSIEQFETDLYRMQIPGLIRKPLTAPLIQ
jgi:hypothetical protein